MAVDPNNQIWLTSALTDNDVPKALTLCFSLKRGLTNRKVGVIASQKISPVLKEALHRGFDLFFYLDEDRNTAGLKCEDFAKLFGLTLKSFRKCFYLEPTIVVIRNCDEVFEIVMHEQENFVFTQKENNMSVLLLRPSLLTFEVLMNSIAEANGTVGLERYLKNWIRNQQGAESKFLQETLYRVISPQQSFLTGNESDVSIVNVIDIPIGGSTENMGIFAQLVLEQRRQIYDGMVQPLLQSKFFAALPRSKCFTQSLDNKEPIAIVGMSCRYPGANNLEEFWNLLFNGEDGTGTPPEFRWRHSAKTFTDCRKTNAGFLKTPVDNFDAKFFGISPKEVIYLDPQHRLLHELVWEALEDATVNPQSLRGKSGGVFIGSWTNEYKDILSVGSDEFYRMYMGNSIGAAAARISHMLDLTGPSLATESGCSSAMVGVHLACKSLQRGESSIALACGVNLLLSSFDKNLMPMVLSPDGHCKTFDANANGFARAEGGGVLVLKRVSDAVKDGDNIWALIRGSGMTQEGISKSMGTPTVHCESMAMKLALEDADIMPDQVSFVEAHGTGTSVGDPMEIAAIAKAYHSKYRKEPLIIGSVKTNVGHTESCSGITGITKVVLALHNEVIPAHRNFTTLNPLINLESVPAKLPLRQVPWPKQQFKPRVAGVSSFGITGTDAHVIIEESPTIGTTKLTLEMPLERPSHIMKISARTDEALSILLENYKHNFTSSKDHFKDLAHTSNVGRADLNQRAVIIAKSNEEAVQCIEKNKFLRGEESSENMGKICFLFTGQGSQYPGMAKELFNTSPVFRMHFEYCANILKIQYNIDIIQVLWSDKQNSKEISRTIYSQTSIFCVEYALLKLWESWGISADFVLGHSLGEFAAAVCAGILTVEDALKLVAERSLLIDKLPNGKMLVIKASKQHVDSLLKTFGKILDYAGVNSGEQTVVAGDSDDIQEFFEYCKQFGLKCIVLEATHAFHSKHMDPILNEYRLVAETVGELEGSVSHCKYISGMRGTIVESGELDAEYWVQHTREKVSFMKASKLAAEIGCKVFIEIGPQPVLSALTMVNNEGSQLLCLPSLKRNENEWLTLFNTVAKLYVKGVEIDWKGLDQFYSRVKCRLPTYPFLRKTYWPECLAATGVTIHPLLGSVIANASATKLFQSRLDLESLEYIKDHAIGDHVIFPGAGYLEICLAAGWAAVDGSNLSLAAATRSMKVEDLVIEAPLCLEESKGCQIQTVVEMKSSSGRNEDWSDMKVSIFRKMESESDKWLPHAKAVFSPIPSVEEREMLYDSVEFEETISGLSNEEEPIEVYNKLAALGLKFGPTFRSIERVWRKSANALLAKVKLPSEEGKTLEYIIHPVVLDAMIQASMMLRVTSSLKKKLYVPIKIGKFIWLGGINSSAGDKYIQCFAGENDNSPATAVLLDKAGIPLAIMSSVELIDTTVKAIASVLEQQTISMPDMYEEVWKPTTGPHQFITEIEKASGIFYTDEFMTEKEQRNQNPPPHLTEIFRELEQFVYWNMLRGFYDCGWKPFSGHVFEEDVLFNELGISSKHRQYFGFVMQIFEEEGILEKVSTKSSCSTTNWKVTRSVPSLEQTMINLNSPMVSNLVKTFKSTRLFGRIGEVLGAILKDEQSGLSVMFPSEKTDCPSAGDFYSEYAEIFKMETLVGDAFSKWLEYAKNNLNSEKSIIRVLEVGAGTGSLTSTLLRCFGLHNVQFEYTYTDISAAFFLAAEKKFEEHGKHMKFRKLNIEEDPLQQGFSPEYFDYVFTSDVIHATKDIRQSLLNIRMLMKPYGKLDIQEMTRVLRLGTFSFGLLDGFWRFEDRQLRPNHCTISKQAWGNVLEESGFNVTGIFSTIMDYHSYICSERTECPLSDYFVQTLADNSKAWVIFHTHSHPISDFIQDKIRLTTKRHVVLVHDGESFEEANIETNKTIFKINRKEEGDFVNLFKSFQRKKVSVEGIVYCWALNQLEITQNDILQPFFYLAKAVLSLKYGIRPRFYAITSGVVPLENNDMTNYHSSTIWGFLKSMKSENTGVNGKCIEVADGRWDEARMTEICSEIWSHGKESMVVFKDCCRFIPKLQLHKPTSNSLAVPKGTDRFKLILPETKAVSDLQFGPLEAYCLKEDEVEVQVKVSALNFRDVLSIIKPSDAFKNDSTVGFDFAGVIKRVGGEVTKFKAGDRVCGCNVNFLAMPSHFALHQDYLLRLPDDLSYCEGATMPAVYITSVLCLIQVAKITKEDVVLIHTASGGVGLSAIEICKHIGCTIIATAGSKRKQNYLKSVGIKHIFHSRNTEFGDAILKLTNGRGVDVVLNSLTSEGFKEASLKACANGARFVEMSKLNIWTTEEVKNIRPDVDYSAVDLSQTNLTEWGRLIYDLKPLLENNVAKPIPFVRFDALNIREALHYMQKTKHIGKIVCVLPELINEGGIVKMHTPMFSDKSCYLITGGLGGIGFAACEWMVTTGAKHIILAGRNLPSVTIQNKISVMNSGGMNVIPVQLDVGDFEQCKNLIQYKMPDLGLPPLKGIMHAAGTLADGLIVNQDWKNLSSTFRTKIDGTLNLHELTKNLNLEHFVLFSSVAAILGTPGQCNHSAANSFEDSFAHYRHSIGLPATTINWGQWGEVGIATEVDLPGIKTMSNLQGITGLEYVLKTQRTQTAIFNVASFTMLGKFYPHLSAYLDDQIWKKITSGGGGLIAIKSDEFWQQYDSATPENDKVAVLKVQVRTIIRAILQLDESECVDDDAALQEMGVDSLMFVEIKNALQTLLGDRLTVSAAALKDCNTINLLSTTLVALIDGVHEQIAENKPTIEDVNELIREDCILPAEITAKSSMNMSLAHAQTVLLTGCTGVLGPYILKELTRKPQITQVVCLMRPVKNTLPEKRLQTFLEKLEMLQDIPMEKVKCVEGNVADPHLGVDAKQYDMLCEEIDAVFHCAACIQHTEHYRKKDSRNDMRAVNIFGTKNVLRFACEKRVKHVFYASSLLAVSTIDNGRISERWPNTGEFDGMTTFAYPITKYVGDMLMKQAVERGIPCKAFRFPFIVGESKTGRCSIDKNHVLLRYMFTLKSGVLSSTPFPFNMLPVDICASSSVHIFFGDGAESGVYNISHGSPCMDQEFVKVATKFGYTVDIVDFAEFAKRVHASKGDVGAAMDMFKDFYSDGNAIMSLFTSCPVLQKWVEDGNDSTDMWRSDKVLRFIPSFFDDQLDIMDYVLMDLTFCKKQGWFEKFGL